MADDVLISFKPRRGYDLIFRPWYIHPRTGKVIYPKRAKVFPMWIKYRKQLVLPLDVEGDERN